MQRTAWRAGAFLLTVLGFGGLAIAASGVLPWLGLAVAALALLVLLAVAWVALGQAVPGTAAPPMGTDVWELGNEPGDAQAGAPTMDPDADLGFEYQADQPDDAPRMDDAPLDDPFPPAPRQPPRARSLPAPDPAPGRSARAPSSEGIDLESPLQRALAGLPPRPPAPARYSPRMPVIPEEEPEPEEPVRRARRLVPSGQTLGEKREATRKAAAKRAQAEEEPVDFTIATEAPPATTPRPRAAATKVPLMVARKAGKGPTPPELAKGKCSGCGTLLWAPKTRPINLRCPECDKVTLLR